MVKQKAKKVPMKSVKSKVGLAQDIAARVEIVEVKLVETHVTQKLVGDRNPKFIGYGQQCATARLADDVIEVHAKFMLRATDQEYPPPDEAGSQAIIQATFSLKYKVENLSSFSDAQVNAFGDVNGIYNAWPFWREYVYSTLARMGLKPFTMPVCRFGE